MREITVFTHRRPDDVKQALQELGRQAQAAGVVLRFDEEETLKHRLEPSQSVAVDAPVKRDVELCVVLGGDGTILRALQHYVGTEVPVFAINFGEIGFLATVEPDDIEDGIRRALEGDFELLRLPGIVLGPSADGSHVAGQTAINDIAIHRKVGERVAKLESHFRQAQEDVAGIATSAAKVVKRGERIEALEFEEPRPRGQPSSRVPDAAE